jgi:hypothetical protein
MSPVVVPGIEAQIEILLERGVNRVAGLSETELSAVAQTLPSESGVLIVHPRLAPPSALAPLLRRSGKPGFVVTDMADVDLFTPITQLSVPETPLYLVNSLDRGDDMANWSPDEALPTILSANRTPLTLAEGLHFALYCPDIIERNHCFMTIGSRLRRANGELDSRTPAIWISNGTGRDGADNRNAPKVGWCWAGNRHTWLGFASAASRTALRVDIGSRQQVTRTPD